MGAKSITVCLIALLLVTVDWTVIIDENWSNCSIFIVLNNRYDGVNINIPLLNSRITLFPYSNIQGNVTIFFWDK
jgi:hypothetical protein